MLERIAHATDFSEASRGAFAHALRLALDARCRLDILHVGPPGESEQWRSFPRVREMLAGWGLLGAHEPPEAIRERLGVEVAKIQIRHSDPMHGLGEFLLGHRPDLLVVASHGRHGLNLWLKGSVSAEVAQRAHVPTLMIGPEARGFVETATGRLALAHVLMPVVETPSPAQATRRVLDLLAASRLRPEALALVTVGDGLPDVAVGSHRWRVTQLAGPVIDTLLAAARAHGSDLIVMPTTGRHGLLDALRGSTTSRVLAAATCPVLTLPLVAA